MPALADLAAFLDETLNVAAVPDYPNAINGVQVANRGQIERVAAVVPGLALRLVFLDVKNHWGATVELSGKDADRPLTVKLQPCGKALVRFVDGETGF